MIATAPGKLIVSGEYAVLGGAPAIVLAVDRRVVARHAPDAPPPTAFLAAVTAELARRFGPDHPAVAASRGIAVDSSAFYEGPTKLGLGSSAAVTVAATRLALGEGPTPPEAVLAIAAAAHADAQGALGARGSGADIAAAVHGGVIAFVRDGDAPPTIERLAWPASVALVACFTGASADTATLVARVTAARGVEPALEAITRASHELRLALLASHGPAVIAALAAAAAATDQLAATAGVDLVPPCVRAARLALADLGGVVKTTGAGGGDIAIAVIPASSDVTTATRALIEAGCHPLQLSVDPTGVDTRPGAQ